MNSSAKKQFFIFDFVSPKSSKEKDEPRLGSRFICSLIFILLMIDLCVLFFFIKTNNRIDKLDRHNFTRVIQQNIQQSKADHNEYVQNAEKIIQKQNNQIKEDLDFLQLHTTQIQYLKNINFETQKIEELKTKLYQLKKNPKDQQLIENINKDHSKILKNLYEINNQTIPLQKFYKKNDLIRSSLHKLVENIRQNLSGFMEEITALASNQNQNQNKLYKDLQLTLAKFDQNYQSIFINDQNVRLNSFYQAKFYVFDQDFIHLKESNQSDFLTSNVTFPQEFELRLPRIYYCHFQTFLYSNTKFDVKFQYFEHATDYEDEKILFETKFVKGSLSRPNTYSHFHTFHLPKGQHKLQMRILAEPISHQLNMKNMSMQCLSYRKFNENKIY